jgi:hypothetical protein
MKAGTKRRWLGAFATTITVVAIAASPAAAQTLGIAGCGQHAVVNGIRHQPTTAEIESAQSLCGVSSPVDTDPAFGAAIDELYRDLHDGASTSGEPN